MRYMAMLIWLFAPLMVWLLQEFLGHWWPLLIGLLWMFLLTGPFQTLRPPWVPSWLAWIGGIFVGALIVEGVTLLPFVAGLLLAVGWAPVGLWLNMRMERHQLWVAWSIAKVAAWKELVEGGMPERDAAARVNEQFGERP